MATLNLLCEHDHAFEGWFRSAHDFEKQNEDELVACPWCESKAIRRRPNSPNVRTNFSSSSLEQEEGATTKQMPSMQQSAALLSEMHRVVAAHCEDVGEHFPEEVRRVHYGESEARSLCGKASAREVNDLQEEGIPIATLPPLPSAWN